MLLRRMSTFLSTIAILAGGLFVLQPNSFSNQAQVVAQNPPANQPRPNPQPQSGGLVKALNLSPHQIDQIKHIRGQSREQIMQKVRALQQTQVEILNLMAGTASRDQVRNKYNQINAIKQQLADADFDNTLAIREILTPAQRRKFVELMYRRHR
jgi:Spy/CpxP family protein refolding chaperone